MGVGRPKRGGDRPGLAPRVAATQLLAAVLDRRMAFDAALDTTTAFTSLEGRDRALAHAIAAAALRRHGTIDAVLARLIQRRPGKAGGLVRILETAAAQLLFMEAAPHAVVSLAVDQIAADPVARHYKALGNAVLRRIAAERTTLLATVETPGGDVPPWLWARWVSAYGEEGAETIAAAHRREPALDLTVKGDAAVWAERLGGAVLPTGTVRLVPSTPVPALPGFADGAWWVQDAAAALPARLLGGVAGLRVADLCAAPGGKTAQLTAAGALVTAVDMSAERLARVDENLGRLGLAADLVAADVLTWKPDRLFDAVLLDAPCTATGTIRRHPDVPWLKRASDVGALAGLQARLIPRAAAMLRPGGRLVYCTCSLEPEEGESHRSAFAAAGLVIDPVAPDEIGGLNEAITAEGFVRTLPGHLQRDDARLSGVDGFFIARLRKA